MAFIDDENRFVEIVYSAGCFLSIALGLGFLPFFSFQVFHL